VKKHVREYTADLAARLEIERYASSYFEKDKQQLRDLFSLVVPW
jgi:hypothetical protein